MSQDWSDVQNFFKDQCILKAITDLSIAIKQELAGLRNTERAKSAQKAKQTIKEFLSELEKMLSEQRKGIVFGIDSRSNKLVLNFIKAHKDAKNYNSIFLFFY